jgi:hypothetical protein
MALSAGCSERQLTQEERLARGRQIVQQFSDKLSAARAFSVTTDEKRVETPPNASSSRTITLTRETIVRRQPDRLYFRTSGDRNNEAWYDGVGLTFVVHPEKVYAQARLPETLDRALDALVERYGVAMPMADLLYSSPAKALLTDTLSGGWAGTTRIGGEETDHLSFEDHGVMWELWIDRSGDGLPRKATAVFPNNKRLGAFEVTFRNWNLKPDITADRFTPHVPADYEGIAILQRAAILHNKPGQPAATTGRK